MEKILLDYSRVKPKKATISLTLSRRRAGLVNKSSSIDLLIFAREDNSDRVLDLKEFRCVVRETRLDSHIEGAHQSLFDSQQGG
jgi:hypothetical protein